MRHSGSGAGTTIGQKSSANSTPVVLSTEQQQIFVDILVALGGGGATSGTLSNLASDSSVAVGDWVYLDNTFTCQKAKADAMSTSLVLGVVSAKGSSVLADVMIFGESSALFSSLDPTIQYFLSDTTAGAMVAVGSLAGGSGHVVLPLGIATTSTKLLIRVGTRLLRA